MSIATAKTKFQQINLITIVLLFVLILAGGVVRSSGSGMGCPDWPKCFGRYIPPTDVNELPKDYKQTYVAKRMKKNQRFAKTLDVFGYSDLATRIRQDKSILVPEEFNATRTWTEYINRLVGALSGLFLLLSAVYAFNYWKQATRIPVLSVANVILVGFQAWLGSIVVSTNLVAWIVTVHMILALVILAITIYTYYYSKVQSKPAIENKLIPRLLTILAVLLSTVQIVFGTEVREKIDAVATQYQDQSRGNWVNATGNIFTHHRDFALLVVLANVILFYFIRKSFNPHSIHQQLMSFVFLLIMLQVGTGIALSYAALPPIAQGAHIILASLIFGAQFYLLLNLGRTANYTEVRR
ncbi:heme A synthase [Mucilaginibacter robiniae]|uniref:Heme A synthase n=1 Tax=Mucilaginibacter robiniae TaxID=2728022 RepID=A0A7L5DY16_9SPHI|nr:COX15/CtaA family protein [Mucilaginibacter robiniae]QJD95661.1 heme A synthase [Mucilaginibacter robiniae]